MNCEDYPVVVVDLSSSSKGRGACKYYISALGGMGGLKEMLILLMWLGMGE